MGQVAEEASREIAPAHVGRQSEVERALEQEPEERASLSEKERQNEEVNERDNCSASSISSSSSTLEREEKEDKLSRDRGTGNKAPFLHKHIPGNPGVGDLVCWPLRQPAGSAHSLCCVTCYLEVRNVATLLASQQLPVP